MRDHKTCSVNIYWVKKCRVTKKFRKCCLKVNQYLFTSSSSSSCQFYPSFSKVLKKAAPTQDVTNPDSDRHRIQKSSLDSEEHRRHRHGMCWNLAPRGITVWTLYLPPFCMQPRDNLEHGLDNLRCRTTEELNLVIAGPCSEHCLVRTCTHPFPPSSLQPQIPIPS
jgi:hypothetical protein